MVQTFDEKVRSVSPATYGFSRQGGQATLPVYVQSADFYAAIQAILGTVKPKGDGSLQRGLPAAHPRCPWMLAQAITNVVGMGAPTKTVAVQPFGGVGLTYFANYPLYEFNVAFSPEPWVALNDSLVDVEESTYYDDDGVEQPTVLSQEYFRFTSVEYLPNFEIVTATHGQLKFRADSGDPPDGFTFPGAPRVYVGKSALKFTWHYAPYSYLLHPESAIVSMLGRVNQSPFLGYPAGSLLYTAVGVKRYTPPIPEALQVGINQAAFAADLVADYEFVFEYTDREATDPPTPDNDSWVPHGHNAFPWYGDRQFYYVTAVGMASEENPSPSAAAAADTEDKWKPTYKSFCPEWLWTDPAVIFPEP